MAEYRIFERNDGTYGVTILKPSKVIQTVFGDFLSRDEAQAWIADQEKAEATERQKFSSAAFERAERNLPRSWRDKD